MEHASLNSKANLHGSPFHAYAPEPGEPDTEPMHDTIVQQSGSRIIPVAENHLS